MTVMRDAPARPVPAKRRLDADVRACLAAVPVERRALVNAPHELIVTAYPDAVIDMGDRMPTYPARRW